MNDSELSSPTNSSLEGTESIDELDRSTINQPQKSSGIGPSRRVRKIIVIVLLMILIFGGAIVALSNKKHSSKPTQTIVINTQSLDNGTLNKISGQSGQNGIVTQQLTISPSTLFKNDVTIQKSVNIQQDLQVNGKTNLLGPVATGSNVSVGGGLSVIHNTSIGGNLSVSGQISAGSLSVGTLSPSNIITSEDISFGGHLISTGLTPSIKSDLAAGNGTATISGNDAAGTVTINTGTNGSLPNGVLAIINFHKPYGLAPRVQLTPANAQAAELPYYAATHSTFFQVNAASNIAVNTTYQFYYLVTQ